MKNYSIEIDIKKMKKLTDALRVLVHKFSVKTFLKYIII